MKNSSTYQIKPLRAPRPLSSVPRPKQSESNRDVLDAKKAFSRANLAGSKRSNLSISSQSSYSKDTQTASEKHSSRENSLNDISRSNVASGRLFKDPHMYSNTNSIISRRIQKIDLVKGVDDNMSSLQDLSCLEEPVRKLQLPYITAKCWGIMDAKTGELLHSQKDSKKREVASLTKMMNFLCVLKLMKQYKIDPKDTYVQVSKAAAAMKGTSARLKAGDVLSIYDLLYGLMLPSGNDAAVALAENFGTYIYLNSDEHKERMEKYPGLSQDVKNPARYFVKLMNQTAKELGLVNTSYSNPHGLVDPNNFSTVADQAKLTYHLLKWDMVGEIVNKAVFSCEIEEPNRKIRVVHWENTNKLLGKKGWYGVKTGITTAAGPCLSAYYEDLEEAFIIILLSSETKDIRWVEAPRLVEWVIKNRNKL